MAFPEEQAANALGLTFRNERNTAHESFLGVTNSIGALEQAVEIHMPQMSDEERLVLLRMLGNVTSKLLES